jgi:hypothetical protein
MNNQTTRTLAALFIIAAGVFAVHSQTSADPQRMTETERSLRAFYDAYADDLRAHRREAIVDRYDRRGAYLMGNGSKRFETFEQIRDVYVTKWSGPKAFEWNDLSFEPIGKDAAVVVGKFTWQTASGQTMKFSYTGVLVRQDGKWRIRVEDESAAPPKPGSN